MTNTDIGTPGASDNTMPPTAATSAKITDAAIVADGDENSRAAAAAGVINNDITSSAPTICTPCAATTPTSAANTMPSPRTGTPRADATSGSTVANSSGRYGDRQHDATITATPTSCASPEYPTPTI